MTIPLIAIKLTIEETYKSMNSCQDAIILLVEIYCFSYHVLLALKYKQLLMLWMKNIITLTSQ